MTAVRKNESRNQKHYAHTVTLAYGGNWCATDPPDKRQNGIGSSVTETSGIPTPLPAQVRKFERGGSRFCKRLSNAADF